MGNLASMARFVSSHPLASHYLSLLRDRRTSGDGFRWAAQGISRILLVEATSELRLQPQTVETPLASSECKLLAEQVVAISVLRAGLGMLDAAQQLIPNLKVGHIGLVRDEETAVASRYFQKLPNLEQCKVLILEPMIATGGSVTKAIESVQQAGGKRISIVSVIAAKNGIERLESEYPDCDIYCAAIDPDLNDRQFIIPGLGDFGDRLFGTG